MKFRRIKIINNQRYFGVLHVNKSPKLPRAGTPSVEILILNNIALIVIKAELVSIIWLGLRRIIYV